MVCRHLRWQNIVLKDLIPEWTSPKNRSHPVTKILTEECTKRNAGEWRSGKHMVTPVDNFKYMIPLKRSDRLGWSLWWWWSQCRRQEIQNRFLTDWIINIKRITWSGGGVLRCICLLIIHKDKIDEIKGKQYHSGNHAMTAWPTLILQGL